jgi:hypothetical protein
MTRLSTESRVPSKSVWGRVALRFAVGAVVFLALGGPSPGHLGGCSSISSAPDAYTYCVDKRGAICQREYYSGRVNIDVFNACVANIYPTCEGTGWSGCVPTNGQTEACLLALRDETRFPTPDAEIVECNPTLWCAAAGGLTTDDGI